MTTPKTLIEPTHEQVLDFCGRDPVERVFLEDVARRGLGRFYAVELGDGSLGSLCHVGANLVPSGNECGVFADAAAGSGSRMIIGDERAVGELWDAACNRLPGPRDLCRLLLASTPVVTLFVRTDNLRAIRLYESIGMERVGSYRSVLF